MVPETLTNVDFLYTAAALATPYLAGIILKLRGDINILSAELLGNDNPLSKTKDSEWQYLETPDDSVAEVIIKRPGDRFPQDLLLKSIKDDDMVLDTIVINRLERGVTDWFQPVIDGVSAKTG